MLQSNEIVLGPVTANATMAGNVQWVDKMLRVGVVAVVGAGTVNGSMQLQCSNDKAIGARPDRFQPTNWVNVGSSVAIATASSNYLIPYTELSYEYIRVLYTDASGGAATSSIQINVALKGL
jgi:hypothetical protein